MAFNLRITAARATAVQIQADGAAAYTLLVSYRLCVGGPPSAGGNSGAGTTSGSGGSSGSSGKDKGGAPVPYDDVVVGRGERTMTQALSSGQPLPTPTALAAL